MRWSTLPLFFLAATGCAIQLPGAHDDYVDSFDSDGDGFISADQGGDDCDDTNRAVHPEAPERCNSIDDDCNGTIDDDALDAQTWFSDVDRDGYGDPQAPVQACEGGDGRVDNDLDCDDVNQSVSPAAAEICNTVDDDCDGSVDEDATDRLPHYADGDNDGFGDADITRLLCRPGDVEGTTWILDDTDCNDRDAEAFPGADERCNYADDDCDGDVDESPIDPTRWYADDDDDGYGNADISLDACVAPDDFVANVDDCDDTTAAIGPEQEELCDGIDQNCDGVEDDGLDTIEVWVDGDLDGYGDPSGATQRCGVLAGVADNSDDCDDADPESWPGAVELGEDDVDQDCDGSDGELMVYASHPVNGGVLKISLDPVSSPPSSFRVGTSSYDVVVARGWVWMVEPIEGRIYRMSGDQLQVQTWVTVANGTSISAAPDGEHLWVSTSLGEIHRISMLERSSEVLDPFPGEEKRITQVVQRSSDGPLLFTGHGERALWSWEPGNEPVITHTFPQFGSQIVLMPGGRTFVGGVFDCFYELVGDDDWVCHSIPGAATSFMTAISPDELLLTWADDNGTGSNSFDDDRTHAIFNIHTRAFQTTTNPGSVLRGMAANFPTDGDGDGVRTALLGGEDCDDRDPSVNPSAVEVCNGEDTDCDGVVDGPSADLGSATCPAQSCRDVLLGRTSARTSDDRYFIGTSGRVHSVKCDLDTAGGGWTRVLKTQLGDASQGVDLGLDDLRTPLSDFLLDSVRVLDGPWEAERLAGERWPAANPGGEFMLSYTVRTPDGACSETLNYITDASVRLDDDGINVTYPESDVQHFNRAEPGPLAGIPGYRTAHLDTPGDVVGTNGDLLFGSLGATPWFWSDSGNLHRPLYDIGDGDGPWVGSVPMVGVDLEEEPSLSGASLADTCTNRIAAPSDDVIGLDTFEAWLR